MIRFPDPLIEKRFHDLLNNINDLVTVASPEGIFTYVSPSCKRIQGYEAEEMEGISALDFIHPEDIAHVMQTTNALVNGNYSGSVVFRGRKKEGGYVWLESTGNVVFDEDGNLLEIHGCTRDITERILYEQELEKKNAQLQAQVTVNENITQALLKEQLFKESIIENNPTGIAALNLDLVITEWNPSLEMITGIKREHAIGTSWFALYPNVKGTESHHIFLKVLKGETIYIAEKEFYNRSGYYSTYLAPLRDESGAIFGMLSLITDITERKEAAMLLKEQKSFLNQITDHVPSIIYVYDLLERKQIFINNKITHLLGYLPEDYGIDLYAFRSSIIHPDDREVAAIREERITAALDGDVIEDELRIQDKAGNWRWMQSKVIVFKRTPGEKPWQILGTITDITALKQAEEAQVNLRTTERLLRKKEEFISIASHELKTPLTSIKAYMQLLQHSDADISEENKKQFIDRTATYVDKLNKLVEDLLNISKIQAGRMAYSMQEFDIDTMVYECIETYQRISSKHRIECTGTTGMKILGDRQRLEQVLTNLLSNAIKYSPTGNLVEVTLSGGKDIIQIDVTDFGIGIAADKQAQIFDRFYRVEDAPSYIPGLGIGLYITKEIVTRHGGMIAIRSNDPGTTFSLTLPAIS